MNGSDPEACLAACKADERCRAFSWTEPGYHEAGGRCWLKDKVPAQERNEHVVSGVVRTELWHRP